MQKYDASKNYYEVLGLEAEASQEEIDRAYRSAARLRHPDSGGSEEAMKLLNEAHDLLSDPQTRREYDDQRAPKRPVYGSSIAFDPDAAARAGTLKIEVEDMNYTGLVMGALTCFGIGIPLLMLVEMQWVFFLWPLRILTLGGLAFGVLMANSALTARQRNLQKSNLDSSRRRFALQRLLLWLGMIVVLGSLFYLLYFT